MVVQSGRRLGISDLPQEMQVFILKKLPTEDLLVYRLVSRIWKSFCTELCRHRKVKLREKWFDDVNGMDILRIFDHDDLPWSSYALSNLPTGVKALTRPFLDKFGSYLWDTEIHATSNFNFSTIIEYLQRTPNLRSLVLNFDSFSLNEDEDEDPPELEPVSLPRLKKLKLTCFNEEVLTFLPSLISAPRLELLKIAELELYDRESAERAASLFANIPIIDLDVGFGSFVHPDVITELSTKALRIRKLVCQLGRISLGDYERFFSGLDLGILKKLELDIKVETGDVETPFLFPKCRALKELHINLSAPGDEMVSCPEFIRGIFSTMESHNFPLLKKVWILSEGLEDSNLFNPSCSFETVKELTIEYVDNFNFLVDWIHLFPNVTKLKLQFRNTNPTRDLRPYLFSMLKLQCLEILIDTSDYDVDDPVVNIMLWLAGIDESLDWKSEEEVTKYRETHDNPSILQLTELKEVELKIDGPTRAVTQARDAALCLTFLPLHKLDTLAFWGLAISDECEAKLTAYHGELCGSKVHLNLRHD